MNKEININVDDLKKNYEYDENNYEEYEAFLDKFFHLSFRKLDNLIQKIEELIQKLRDYNGKEKMDKEKYLKKMEKSLDSYKFLNEKIMMDWVFYTRLMRDFDANLEFHHNINHMKDSCQKIKKEVLNLAIQQLIKFDINILNQLNLINYIYLLFKF